MQDPKRQKILSSLLGLDSTAMTLAHELATLPWNLPEGEPPVLLTREHVASALRRYISGSISAAEVESWANLIEGREDVAFAAPLRDTVKECLFELANPEITEDLSHESARAWLHKLALD